MARRLAVELLEDRVCLSAYSLEVLAMTGQTDDLGEPIQTLGADVSINAQGRVVFTADVTEAAGVKSALLVSDGSGARKISFPQNSASRLFGFPQINDDNDVIARDVGGGFSFVRTWESDDSQVPSFQRVIRASSGTSQVVVTLGAISTVYPALAFLYPGVQIVLVNNQVPGLDTDLFTFATLPSYSNDGGIAFIGQLRGSNTSSLFLKLPDNDGIAKIADLTGGGFRPMVGDHGLVVMRMGGAPTDPIALFVGANRTDVATTAMGFTRLDNSPGISDDGEIVAFSGADADGDGIFLHYVSTGETIRVAGVGGNGVLDPGETYTDNNGNGEFDAGDVDVGIFTSLGRDFSRVAVNRSYGYANPYLYTVAFVGDNSAGDEGLFTLQHDTVSQPGVPAAFSILNAISVGSAIVPLAGTVDSINVYDPLNNDGKLAFYAHLSSGASVVVRAELPDADKDGLYDSWEQNGIDLDGDGSPELTLENADWRHKNLYVEVDAVANYAPMEAALDDVVAAFADAPQNLVNNPNGQKGITLTIVDSSVASERAIPGTGEFGFDPWTPFHEIKADHFGTPGDSGLVKLAKSLAYRYAIFAKEYLYFDDDGTLIDSSSGYAEIGGNDFIVTLGNPVWQGGTRDEQAGTFMHELGHTLGLLHGGDQNLHLKPNYYSVMNYLWQTPHSKYVAYWNLDYSTQQMPDLHEFGLNELTGIGGPIGVQVPIGPKGGPRRLANMDGPVDWSNSDQDADGLPENDMGVLIDINGDGVLSAFPLTGYEDWSHLQYNFRRNPAASDGVTPDFDLNDVELTFDLAQAINNELIGATSPADFDQDGVVDGADFLAWQRGMGAVSGAARSDGDADGDGAVDGDDLALWREGFGDSPNLVSGMSSSVAAARSADALDPRPSWFIAEPTVAVIHAPLTKAQARHAAGYEGLIHTAMTLGAPWAAASALAALSPVAAPASAESLDAQLADGVQLSAASAIDVLMTDWPTVSRRALKGM